MFLCWRFQACSCSGWDGYITKRFCVDSRLAISFISLLWVWFIAGKQWQFFFAHRFSRFSQTNKTKNTSGYPRLDFHWNLESHAGLNKSSIVDVPWLTVAFCLMPLKLATISNFQNNTDSSPVFTSVSKYVWLCVQHIVTTDDLYSVAHLCCCRCGFWGRDASSCPPNLTANKTNKHQQLIQVHLDSSLL